MVICIGVVIAYDSVQNWDRMDINEATCVPARFTRQRNCRTGDGAVVLAEDWSSACGAGLKKSDMITNSISLKVDAVTGDMTEVTFVEYGNSATCALGHLQPWDALIGEDGQLVEK